MFCVHIYTGSLALVGRSGVGQAANHQQAALRAAGAKVVTRWDPPADVIHLNTVLPCSLRAARRARRRGLPVVWFGHSTEEDFRHSFTGSDLLAPLFRRWICHCYNQADLVLTPTPYSAGLLRSYGIRPPVAALSNGVDTDFFAPDPALRAAFRQRCGLTRGPWGRSQFFQKIGTECSKVFYAPHATSPYTGSCNQTKKTNAGDTRTPSPPCSGPCEGNRPARGQATNKASRHNIQRPVLPCRTGRTDYSGSQNPPRPGTQGAGDAFVGLLACQCRWWAAVRRAVARARAALLWIYSNRLSFWRRRSSARSLARSARAWSMSSGRSAAETSTTA